jgi:hypothetical protein
MKKLLILSIALTSIFHVTRGEPIDDLAEALKHIASEKHASKQDQPQEIKPQTAQEKLKKAISLNDYDEVKSLLEKETDMDLEKVYTSEYGTFSALGYAIHIGNKEIVELLLEQIPQLNLEAVIKNQHGTIYSALGFAIMNGKTDIVKLLLKRKPDLNSVIIFSEDFSLSAAFAAKDKPEILELIEKARKERATETI